jgi:hypothetical protein
MKDVVPALMITIAIIVSVWSGNIRKDKEIEVQCLKNGKIEINDTIYICHKQENEHSK